MKTQLAHLVLIIILMGVLSGFQKDLSTIKTEQKIGVMEQTKPYQTRKLLVIKQDSTDIPSLLVKHEIKGNHLLIECIVTGISFRTTDQSKQKIGKIVVWIDGEKNKEVAGAALIIKGLTPGSHKVVLEVVNMNNEPYGLAKEFIVNIPK